MPADVAHWHGNLETLLRRWWAIAGLVLFTTTWKLWTPQTEFPQVPLFGWTRSLPPLMDRLAFGVLLGSLATVAWKPASRRSWRAFVVSLSVLIVIDQHRLQPWAWQLWLMAVCWSVGQVFNLPGHVGSRQVENLPHVLLTISIYFWSAVSKFDTGFYASHGQTLVEALFHSIGVNAAGWPASVKWWLAISLPLGELLVAVGLCWSRTRRTALIAATALHVGLILTLGPTGLGHRPGVLLWNAAFIGHDWLLFGSSWPQAASLWRFRGKLAACRYADRFVSLLVTRSMSMFAILFACVWPITARWGLCDHWLSWSVYSTRTERVSVTLTDEGVRRLPEPARRLAADGELWLDRWSLAALDVPIYPQLRFQFGVVEGLRRQCGEENLVEINVQWTQRDGGVVERLMMKEFDERKERFWINTQPRGAL